MNTNTPDRAKSSRLAHPYEGQQFAPAFVSEKLHDLFAYWNPLTNSFHTKSGMKWKRGVLAHIQPTFSRELIGGLYSPTLSLSELTSAVGVARDFPGLFAESVKFYVYTSISPHAFTRRELELWTADLGENVVYHKQTYCATNDDIDVIANRVRQDGGEGVILNRPRAPYGDGATVKIKFWQDVSFPIVHALEGFGKFTNMLGAVVVQLPSGGTFSVGTMAITEGERADYWSARDLLPGMYAHCKYLHTSNDGIPLNASLLTISQKAL